MANDRRWGVMAERVLIVDDEADLLKLVDFNFRAAGFQTLTARGGVQALELARLHLPDLILLDLMLPDLQGTEVCRQLKQSEATRHIPIIFLTAKGDEIDRVVGFELGADDYVTKPFSTRELILRAKAVLKRQSGQAMGGVSAESPVVVDQTLTPSSPTAALGPLSGGADMVRFGSLTLNEMKYRVWVLDEEVRLTAREFKLLNTFLKNRGHVQTREQLLDDVWGADVSVTTRTVDTHVKRLREKLNDAGRYIETVRGVGYRFAESAME
jgi:two-component system, OmpR family, phosphate regulon response regulator PhoB